MNTSSSRRDSGFTIIELIIVLVIIAILATLVMFSYSGVRSRDRDALRQERISTIQGDLEIFYAEHSRYPTLAQLNNAEWRQKNMSELDQTTIQSPGWTENDACSNDGQPIFVDHATENCFAYTPTAADGESCDNDKKPCAHYTLATPLESGEDYIKTSLN